MKELSLNVLDIAENSVRAGATLVTIEIEESEACLVITVTDDGCGMSPEQIERLKDPFFTTRTTRSVGLGIPLFLMAAHQTGGDLSVSSSTAPEDHGTRVQAKFDPRHIDCVPLGDISSTLLTLIQGSADIDFHFRHHSPHFTVELDTRKLREILGDVPLNTPEVLQWIREFLSDQYDFSDQKN